tara:strand:- start:36 stop:725 length:690 start_codon:yes stop_codon:yes gene_type:complete
MSNGAKLNEGFRIDVGELEDRLSEKLNGGCDGGYNHIVPLRDVFKVEDIRSFKTEVIDKLIRLIPLRSEGEVVYPYEHSEINIFVRGSKGIDVGQTFVLKSKVLGIMEGLGRGIFSDFETNGISHMSPARVYGKDSQGESVLAFYLPPFIEIHNDRAVLIDGMHRNYICMSAGTPINAIHLSYVSSKLPFKPISWGEVDLVDDKPPVSQRYNSLDKSLFRDLGVIGVDG